jgi:hypothetical protein
VISWFQSLKVCFQILILNRYSAEVDTPEGIADGSVPGAKRAAVRKLQHELGIPPEQVPAVGAVQVEFSWTH